MREIFFKILLRFSLILIFQTQLVASKFLQKEHRQDFSLLLNFTCGAAKDELEKHPEMQTIAMVELENNFPREFSREIQKCLPKEVAVININPHWQRLDLDSVYESRRFHRYVSQNEILIDILMKK